MSWGIVAALAPELRATLRALGARRLRAGGRTFYAAGPLVFGWGGVGPDRSARCAVDLLDRFRTPILVSTGFAGALRSDLRPGAIVAGGATGFPASTEALGRARAAAASGAAGDAVFRLHEGEMLSVDRVLLLASAKDEAFRRTGALAIDMESAALARLARDRSVGFLCVKAILDTPDVPVASRYEGLAALGGEILRRPILLRGLFADLSRARVAARSLADFYLALARSLGADP